MKAEKITQSLNALNGTVYFEDPAEFERLLAALRGMYQPSGPVEEFLIEQMASAQWNIRRSQRMLTGLVDYQTAIAADRLQTERKQDRGRTDHAIHHQNTILMGAAFHFDCKEERAQLRLHRTLMDLDRAYHRALKALESAQAQRTRPIASEAKPKPAAVTVQRASAAQPVIPQISVAIGSAPQVPQTPQQNASESKGPPGPLANR
ncbi:MAG TPA: hypothetical protein VKV15_14625 [Bryobacteraceae bacterium]|nr:hypothetical protein [Bryobacteraceae bacterium]